jgi:1-acyl-sn-glycerol-3-phosphate acyltransferase
LTKIRGYLALITLLLALLASDPIQRLIIAPRARLFPSSRKRILTRWQDAMARLCMGMLSFVGGARFPALPSIPGRRGTLVLMNHQSVMDIPLVVASVNGAYPIIVTRKRYFRWIPLISHMLRLYQYPMVDPTANRQDARKMLADLGAAARDADVPLAIFPEGTRTKDGQIGRFKTRGLKEILAQGPWTVHVLVSDGYWERAKLKHFIAGMGRIRGRMEYLGTFEWTDPHADPDDFLHGIRERMVDCLADMRAGVTV